MRALLDFLRRFCSSVANLMPCHSHRLAKTGSQLEQSRVSHRAAARPTHPLWSGAEPGQGPGLVQQPLRAFLSHQPLRAFLSHPPASPIPALAQPGEATGAGGTSCVQVALTIPLPSRSMGGFYSLPSLFAQRGGEG